MNATAHIEQDNLALYAMQLMSGDEMAAAKAHLDDCPECRKEVAALQGDLAAYACTVEMEAPSAQARARLLRQVSREKKVVSISQASAVAASVPPAVARPLLGARTTPWIGWAVAAGLALATTNLYREREALHRTAAAQDAQLAQVSSDAARARLVMETMTAQTAMRVTLTQPKQTAVPLGRATYLAEKGSLVFIASNMAPLQADKVYELWLIPADGRAPMAAGTFHPDAGGNASVILPDLPKGVAAKAFGVTIEAEGGSSVPTQPIIMVGA